MITQYTLLDLHLQKATTIFTHFKFVYICEKAWKILNYFVLQTTILIRKKKKRKKIERAQKEQTVTRVD